MENRTKQFEIYRETKSIAKEVCERFKSKGIADERYLLDGIEKVEQDYLNAILGSLKKWGSPDEQEIVIQAYVSHFVKEAQKMNDRMFEQEKEIRFLRQSLVQGNRSVHYEIDTELVDTNGNHQLIRESYKPSWRTMTQVRWIGLKGKKIIKAFWIKQSDALAWLKSQNK